MRITKNIKQKTWDQYLFLQENERHGNGNEYEPGDIVHFDNGWKRDDMNVDFHIVGSTKCGTTWLKTMLDFHPSIYMNEQLEATWYDADSALSRKWHEDSNWTASKSRDSDVLRGAKRPTLVALFPYSAALLHYLYPNTKIIICWRNPIIRALSWYNMRSRMRPGLFPVGNTFEDEIMRNFSENPDPDAFSSEAEYIPYLGPKKEIYKPHYLQAGCYGFAYKEFVKYFGESNVLVLKLSDTISAPIETLNKIFAFLGLSNIVEGTTLFDGYNKIVNHIPHNGKINTPEENHNNAPCQSHTFELMINYFNTVNQDLPGWEDLK